VGEEVDRDLEPLLHYLRENRGFDFTGYKHSSLFRRIQRRMEATGVGSVDEYLDRLQVDPDEFTHLFNFILINVTGFFRDPAVWDYLADEIVSRVLEARQGGSVRMWVPGCASGEEPYSLAMVLAERLGIDGLRERVKIYATDVDEQALAEARAATYSQRSIAAIPPMYRPKYLDQAAGAYTVKKTLRAAVVFGRHNLVEDAPISRVDLLMCRNTLMYLNAETQAKVMSDFAFGLVDGGYLVLGKAEMPVSHLRAFVPVDRRRRVFMKTDLDDDVRLRLADLTTAIHEEGGAISSHLRGRDTAFELGPVAQLVVDRNGVLTTANGRARRLFDIAEGDIGRPLQDLDVALEPVVLRPHLQRVQADRAAVTMRDLRMERDGEELFLELELTPLQDRGSRLLGVSISFHDVTRMRRLQDELESTHNELETALEELQSTNEELETTNEELQSTNEELETTNEELQSTNEELETMNEELQSTNEELETMNEEARRGGDELQLVNTFLTSVLGSIRNGVVVLDAELRVALWNDRARDLWGLSLEDVRGTPFLALDIGLPVDRLEPELRASLQSGERREVSLEAINRRGQSIVCRVSTTPMLDQRGGITGVIVAMEAEPAAQGRVGS
jgi:two-component system, chemotaxis family, CheB/CheR fusion protein